MKKSLLVASFLSVALFSSMASANEHQGAVKTETPSWAVGKPVVVQMNELGWTKAGKASYTNVGTVTLYQTKYGVVAAPNLHHLPANTIHGFHVHAGDSCAPAVKNGKEVLGLAAKGHYDPDHTGQHGYAWDDHAHRGDLPVLIVNADGNAVEPVLAPRLTLKEMMGHALMIHAGGDNHSDHPKPLGGGGARLVCGVIK